MKHFNMHSPGAQRAEQGFSILEVMLAIVLVAATVLGVTAGFSTAIAAQRATDIRLDGQLLLGRVCEEIQAIPHDGLLGLHGTFVEEGDQRADIRVVQVAGNLVQVQVDVASLNQPEIQSTGVLFLANPE